MESKATTTIRIDLELYKKLKKISLVSSDKISDIGNRLIEEGLERDYNMEDINKKLREELDL